MVETLSKLSTIQCFEELCLVKVHCNPLSIHMVHCLVLVLFYVKSDFHTSLLEN